MSNFHDIYHTYEVCDRSGVWHKYQEIYRFDEIGDFVSLERYKYIKSSNRYVKINAKEKEVPLPVMWELNQRMRGE